MEQDENRELTAAEEAASADLNETNATTDDQPLVTPYEVPVVEADDSLLQGTAFGMSREEQEQAEKEAEVKRQQEKAELKRQAAARARAVGAGNKSGLIFLIVLVALVVAVLVVGAAWPSLFSGTDSSDKEQNTELSYFQDDSAEPDMSDEGIQGAIMQAYYTQGGYLAVKFNLSNGTDDEQHLTSIYVSIENEDGTVIATGYSENIDADYTISSGCYSTFMLYISPEYVQVTDDDLDQITYTITTTCELV